MRIGLFGGTFDPVHNGHIELAKVAINRVSLDKLIFIPTSKNPLKKFAPVATNLQRYEMLNLAVKDLPQMEVSNFEINKSAAQSYSIDTVRHFAAVFGSSKENLFFLLGADNLPSLHLWKDYKQLFRLCSFLLFSRNKVSEQQIRDANAFLSEDEISYLQTNFTEFDNSCSSTAIRAELSSNQAMLAPIVFRYIKDNNLYQ